MTICNMKIFRHIIISAGLLLCIAGCNKDDEFPVVVDSRLQALFDQFVAEGAERGVIVDFDMIPVSGRIEAIDEANVKGQCIHNSARPEELRIDESFWNGASNIEREFVVFHELGHCYLKRSHLDTENPDGTCFSMMHGGTSGCTNTYSTATREALLDELFNP